MGQFEALVESFQRGSFTKKEFLERYNNIKAVPAYRAYDDYLKKKEGINGLGSERS
jgi:hypothetical protein